MAEKKEKLIFITTCAEENPDKATLPFVLGNAALAMDVEVIVVLQSMGVYLAMKQYARHVKASGLPALEELRDLFLEHGGKLWVCDPCIQARQIAPEELIEGAEVVAGATLVDGMLDAKSVVAY